MLWLSFDALALGILAACELMARSLWPELFDAQTLPTPEADEAEEAQRDEMAIW